MEYKNARADLDGAYLGKADLSGADIDGANIRRAGLTGALMPDGTVHD